MGIGLQSPSTLRDGQLHLLHTNRREYRKNETISLRAYEDTCLLVVIHKGGGEIQPDEAIVTVACGHYCLMSPQGLHWLRFSSTSTVTEYRFRMYDEALENVVSAYPAFGRIDGMDSDDLSQWFHLLQEYNESPQPLTLFRMDSGFKGTLLSLLQKGRMSTDRQRERFVFELQSERHPGFPIAAFIHKHVSDKLTLVDIAKHFGFHPHYIIKICNDRMGKSPMQYLQDLRLEKAMDYLETTDWTISEISDKLGWTTSYFSRLFHQKKGMSPSHYRKAVLSPIGRETEWRSNKDAMAPKQDKVAVSIV